VGAAIDRSHDFPLLSGCGLGWALGSADWAGPSVLLSEWGLGWALGPSSRMWTGLGPRSLEPGFGLGWARGLRDRRMVGGGGVVWRGVRCAKL